MKLSNGALAFAIATLMAAGQASAQQSSRLAPPPRQAAYAYDAYYAQESGASPSDAPEAPSADPAPAAAATGCAPSGCASNGCESNGCESNGCAAAEEDDMCHLFECCWTKERGITIGGWTAQSYTWNPGRPADRFNGPVTWTDRSNDYQLNQQYLYVERATNTDGDGWDIGGRADGMFGTDARFTTAAGLETGINNNGNRFYKTAFPQFYGEVAYNNLKVKMGHFYSPVGYFVVPTINNFFNSLPYTFQYGEPFTHMGMLATWTMNDHWTIGSGFIRGWDNFGGFNPNLGYLGTLTWTGDANDSLAFVYIQDHEPDANSVGVTPPAGGRVFTSRYLHTLVYSKQFDDNWTWVAQSDLGVQGAAFGPGTRTARWYGLNQYLFYKVNDSWTWGVGYEWFRDEAGFRVGNLFPSAYGPSSSGNPVAAGFAGNFNQCTVGPQWRPNGSKNLMVRPNARWDWYGGSRNGAAQLPYDSGTRSQQFILGTDVVLIY